MTSIGHLLSHWLGVFDGLQGKRVDFYRAIETLAARNEIACSTSMPARFGPTLGRREVLHLRLNWLRYDVAALELEQTLVVIARLFDESSSKPRRDRASREMTCLLDSTCVSRHAMSPVIGAARPYLSLVHAIVVEAIDQVSPLGRNDVSPFVCRPPVFVAPTNRRNSC
jgi:hypothetical protein